MLSRTRSLLGLLVTASLVAACGDDGGGGAGADTSVPDDVAADASDTTTPDDTTDVADAGDDDAPDAAPDAAPDTTPGDVAQDVEDDVVLPTGLRCEADAVTTTLVPGEENEIELDIVNATFGVALTFTGSETRDERDVTLACAPDLGTEGYLALGPAFTVSTDGGRFRDRYSVFLPFEPGKLPAGARPSSIRVLWQPPGADAASEPIVLDLQENMVRGNVRFRTELAGTFQLVARTDAGQPFDRRWTYRAITGISMGASGASMVGLRNPDMFDIIAPLGGPTDWRYLFRYIGVGGMGGFQKAPGTGAGQRFVPTEEFEHNMAYDDWYFPTGEGTGGTFDRGSYAQIFLDLALGFGNMVMYRPDSPYAPPGMPLELLTKKASERCPTAEANVCPASNFEPFRIATGFFDDEYNPQGTLPVIAFCDGQGSNDRTIPFDRACDIDGTPGPDEPNKGLYTSPCDQNRPMDITYAVDQNGNGVRDPGEPILRNFHEPFEDVGVDGIPSSEEEGYDPVTNPDPAGDDYDYVRNPFGTEGNWVWDEGEPWEDWGIDGVEGTTQIADGGYDWGEGNDVFDYNPNVVELLERRNPTRRYELLSEEERRRLTIYIDAGIRDLFNFAVSGNHFAGRLHGLGANFRVYDDFNAVLDVERGETYNAIEVDYQNLGDNVYVRYGDPAADEELICYGDGKHVGTVPQVANRILTMLGFVTNRFPNPDRTPIQSPFPLPVGTYYHETDEGRIIKYSIAMPPGYEWTQCSDGRDNDGDGKADGEDPDCLDGSVLSEAGESVTVCTDGIDNDEDGLIDANDPDCTSGDGSSEWPTGSPFRDARFPVVYLLHGYGQAPEDLQATALPFAIYMSGGTWPKAITVYPNGYCGENAVTQCNDGIDNDNDGVTDRDDPNCGNNPRARSESGEDLTFCNDGVDNDRDGFTDVDDLGCGNEGWDSEADCNRGNFYTDHVAAPDGTPGGSPNEQEILQLIEHVDARYRTRRPETITERR